MTDWTSCPACDGKGIVPLDAVADLTAAELERQVERGKAQLGVLERIAEDPPPTRSRETRPEP